MKRIAYQYLIAWANARKRKPLIIRGARQVGKTHLVRNFSHRFVDFVEINFEETPEAMLVFEQDLDPHRILRDLTVICKKKIVPGETLLFFDEIQVAPKAITALRYFYEKLPELHLIAAGSLLDFALEKIGVPVGRVNYLYVYPMTFIEFLKATGNEQMIKAIVNHDPLEPMNEVIHINALRRLAEYIIVGGMPEAVHDWLETGDFNECADTHNGIIETYRDDFPKYANEYQIKYLQQLFRQVPQMLTRKFDYSYVEGNYRKRELEPSLDLLCKAGIIHKIYHTAGQGVPIGAGAHLDRYKCIMLDIALTQTELGIDTKDWILDPLHAFINRGEIAEAFVGQEIKAYDSIIKSRNLYYWHREERGSSAEVDYLIQDQNLIVPIEVKSGSAGKLKSLRMFLDSHPESPFGVRFFSHNYVKNGVIQSYPLYAIANLYIKTNEYLRRFCEDD